MRTNPNRAGFVLLLSGAALTGCVGVRPVADVTPGPATPAVAQAALPPTPAPPPPVNSADRSRTPAGVPVAWTANNAAAVQELGRDADFRWVQGKVMRLHTAKGRFWQLRYADLHRSDPHGGRVVLEGNLPSDLRDGDLVRVDGHLPTPVIQSGGGPVYRVHRVLMLRRG